MIYKFDNQGPYIEAWEYLMRIHEGFACDPENYIIEIRPMDTNDDEIVFDPEVVERLDVLCGKRTNADVMRAKELEENRK